jgi:hypothetical protein
VLAFTPRRPHPWSGAVGRTGSCTHRRDRKTVLSQNAALVPRNSLVIQVLVPRTTADAEMEVDMGFGRGVLFWLLGVPIPIIILLTLFWHH